MNKKAQILVHELELFAPFVYKKLDELRDELTNKYFIMDGVELKIQSVHITHKSEIIIGSFSTTQYYSVPLSSIGEIYDESTSSTE